VRWTSAAALSFFIFASVGCRANYKDWQTPDCRIDKPDLTILQFSDTHLRGDDDARGMLERLKAAQEKYRPDVLVLTGDITNTGQIDQWRAFATALKEMRPEPLLVWGNHDMPLKETEFKNAGLTRFQDFGDYRLVLIDTAWDGWFVGSYTSVPESEFPLLQRAAATDKYIVLFTHHPLGKDAPHFRLNNADAVLGIFRDKNLIASFSGHFHGAYLAPEGKILFAGTAPLSPHKRNHTMSQGKGYRIIELQNGCLRTHHVLLD
jgi:3',5'-cyclic AMP phosphodiesterase CpdA